MTMSQTSDPPTFSGRSVELRCDGEEVAIYATRAGLEKLMAFCQYLLDHPERGSGHTHLEEYEVLTTASLRGTLVLCED